jgi:hypothetical protein
VLGRHRHARGSRSPVIPGRRAWLILAMVAALGFAAAGLGLAVSTRPPPTPAPGSPGAPARTRYYVDCTGGSDSNAGTSAASAWASLARASSAPLKPGDTLLLADGCTFDGTLRASWRGTASARITIEAYGTGSAPVIHQSASDSQDVAVTGTYIVISGLDLTASPPAVLASCDNAADGWIVNIHVSRARVAELVLSRCA